MKFIFVIVLVLAGCTIISHKPPPDDWPRLSIIHAKHESAWSVISHCYQYTPLWAKLLGGFNIACAEIDLRTMTCTIHVSPSNKTALKHELDHCEGRDHLNSNQLADLWDGWKKSMTKNDVPYYYIRHDGQQVRASP